jgi:hypothetical protein
VEAEGLRQMEVGKRKFGDESPKERLICRIELISI